MNQAASVTRRSPADPTAAAGCCPMFNAPFFGLASATSSGPQCGLRSPAQQLAQLTRQHHQQTNSVIAPQPRTQQATVSQQQRQNQSNPTGRQLQQQQMQPQQLAPPSSQGSQDYTSTNYSTSAPNLSLQHLASNGCMALAAALASASLPHLQQQPITQQSHQQVVPPINQPTTNNIVPSTVSTLSTANSTTTPLCLTNQVPIMNYNSYPPAQILFNLQTLNVPQAAQSQQTPPVAAHSGPNTNHQQTNSIPNLIQSNLNSSAHPSLTGNVQNNHRGVQQTRPLVANSTLNSSAGPQQQQQVPNYRPAQQHQPPAPTPAQQLGQVTRIDLEALNSLFNDQFQAFLLYQLFSSHQFAPPLANSASHTQAQQVDVSRPHPPPPNLPLAGSGQGSAPVMTSAQQIGAPPQSVTQHSSEPASEGQQQAFNPASQSRPAPLSSVNNSIATNSLYQSQQRNDPAQPLQQLRPQVELNLQPHQQVQPQIVLPSPPTLQAEPQQPQQNLPPMPFYSYPQMEQALSLLTNPQNADNIFSHLFNMYLQSGLRTEPHSQHHHPPHFHHHLHGAHHHHHHHSGQDGQPNGQDATIPLDSMAINESKPRGLTRAEIDSLPPYTHSNEKDARTCVICLSKFELKSKIRPLSCSHVFHAKCVDKWLRANRTCPICRRDALKTFNGKIKRI